MQIYKNSRKLLKCLYTYYEGELCEEDANN